MQSSYVQVGQVVGSMRGNPKPLWHAAGFQRGQWLTRAGPCAVAGQCLLALTGNGRIFATGNRRKRNNLAASW